MKLRSDEVELRGGEYVTGDKVVPDGVWKRISILTREHLEKVCTDPTGWDILYKDTADGRFWELIYPESYIHGGGPPTLRHLSKMEVENKYGEVPSGDSK